MKAIATWLGVIALVVLGLVVAVAGVAGNVALFGLWISMAWE